MSMSDGLATLTSPLQFHEGHPLRQDAGNPLATKVCQCLIGSFDGIGSRLLIDKNSCLPNMQGSLSRRTDEQKKAQLS